MICVKSSSDISQGNRLFTLIKLIKYALNMVITYTRKTSIQWTTGKHIREIIKRPWILYEIKLVD